MRGKGRAWSEVKKQRRKGKGCKAQGIQEVWKNSDGRTKEAE